MRPFSGIFAALLLSQSAYANCQSVTGEYRKCFDSDNAPPGLVYRMFVNWVFMDSLDYLEDLSRIESERGHAGWHSVKAGLTPNMSSADIVRYFVPRFLEMAEEAHEAQKRTLCSDGVPRYDGVENLVVLNQLDEVALNVYEKYYLLARSDLQASGLYDLDTALAESSGSFVVTFSDHSLESYGSVDNIYEAAKQWCASPWGYQISQ